MSYQSPSSIIFLLGIPVILLFFWILYSYRSKTINSYFNKDSQKNLIIPFSSLLYCARALCFCFAWFFSVIALMEPVGHGLYPEEISSLQTITVTANAAHDVIFLLDTSSSMNVSDFRLGKTRLEYAKEIIDDVVSELKGENVSLYSMTSDLVKLVPSTLDYLFFRAMLKQVNINEGGVEGTDFLSVLHKLNQDVLNKYPDVIKTVVIFSDGDDAELSTVKGEAYQRRLESIRKAVNPNYKLISIGLGTKTGGLIPNVSYEGKPVKSTLNEELLKTISPTYYTAENIPAFTLVSSINREIERQGRFQKGMQEKSNLIYQRYFQFPLGIAILLLWLALHIPEVLEKREVQA